jgi:hypothetical protein
MRSMKRIIQVATIAIVFFLWAPVGNASWSCWCFKPHVREAFDRAKVVFVGEVVEVIPPRSTGRTAKFLDSAHTFKFKVETAWKEPFWTEITVFARIGGCFGLQMLPEKGEKYLVYAEPVYPDDPSRIEVMTSSCTRTARLTELSFDRGFLGRNQAAEDIRELNNIVYMLIPQRKPVLNRPRLIWP